MSRLNIHLKYFFSYTDNVDGSMYVIDKMYKSIHLNFL